VVTGDTVPGTNPPLSPSGPRIVLLPGLDGTGRLFGPIRRALGGDPDVTVMGYPGTARTIEDCARHAAARIPADRPVVLVAESFSGPVAALLAETSIPIAGVVFCASFVVSPRPGLTRLARFLPFAGWLMTRRPALALAARAGLGPDSPRELRRAFRDSVRSVPASTIAARVRALNRLDVSGRLAALADRPVTYLRAAHDRLVPADAVRPFERRLPGLAVHTVDGPHLLLQARPESCAPRIRQLIEVTDP
jgi:pimeloyl-ACP methyl ester carboxylesterase